MKTRKDKNNDKVAKYNEDEIKGDKIHEDQDKVNKVNVHRL